MGQILRLNEFFVEGHERDKSHVLLHIIQPSTPEEEREKGYFFAVCEIENGDKDDILMLQRLIDDIENEYYDIDTLSTPEKNALELVLEKINQENSTKFSADAALNCLIGVIIGKDLVFSYHGKPETLFFYRSKNNEYKQLNLAEEEENEDGKIFGQIIQGKISPNDYLFVSTTRVIDYFTRDRILKITTSRTTEQSAAHLEKVLSGTRNGLSFGGIIVHLEETAPDNSLTKRPKRVMGTGSVNPLFSAEQNTARTLSPSLMPRLGDKMKKNKQRPMDIPEAPPRPATTAQIGSQHLRQHQPVVKKAGAGQETLKVVTQFLAAAGLKIWMVVMLLFKFVLNVLKNIALLLMAAVNFKGRRREIIDNWKREFGYFKNKYSHLPLLTKILGLVSIIVAVLFISSIFYLRYNQKKAEENKIYESSLEEIKNMADSAESTLIYNDTAGALTEADQALAKLSSTTCREDDQEMCSEIEDRIKNIIARARKVIFAEPQVLVDWGVLGAGEVDRIFKIENQIIGYEQNSNQLNIYNLMTKDNETVGGSLAQITGFAMATTPKENDYSLLLTADGQDAAKYNPANKSLSAAEISYPFSDAKIKNAIVYSQRLYSLDAQNNMIYRHSATQNGFGIGNNWLTGDNYNLRDAVDMAIDGSIYVLKQNGEIYKFSHGQKEDFIIQGLDPVLTNADHIYTYNEWNNVYILDTSEKRIVVIDKEGKLIRQYQTDIITEGADMIVAESEGYIYVVENNRLHQMEI